MMNNLITKRVIKLLCLVLAIAFFIVNSAAISAQNKQQDTDFLALQQKLIDSNFIVKLEIPPYSNKYGIKPYGLLEGKSKTIWINPVVFDLGNAKPTLIHEATHAAQLCKGQGSFELLNLDIEPPKMTHPYFLRYHNYRREIEAEAYTVQVQPDNLEIVNNLIDNHC